MHALDLSRASLAASIRLIRASSGREYTGRASVSATIQQSTCAATSRTEEDPSSSGPHVVGSWTRNLGPSY